MIMATTEALREQLLKRRLAGRAGGAGRQFPRADRTQPLPLSSSQRRLWFLDSMQPAGRDYLVPLVRRLRGPLNAEALRRAWLRVVDRHEILRTRYALHGDEPVQEVVGAAQAFHFSSISPTTLETLPQPERHARISELIERLTRMPMSLANAQVARMDLLRLSADDHYLVMVFHHICFDGWSQQVLWRELSAFYREENGGPSAALSDLLMQYADFASWQREQAQRATTTGSLAYWADKLAGLTPLELPADRRRQAVRSTAGDVVSFAIPAELSAAVRARARQHKTTPFVFMLTAFHALLARYTSRTDIAVGIPVAGRDESAAQDLIGCFVNTLVIRAAWDGDPSFTELVRRVRLTVLEAFDHQDVPFESLVDRLAPERDLSVSPLVQVMFSFQSIDDNDLELPGITSRRADVNSEVAKLDLTLQIQSGRDGVMSGVLEYSTELFGEQTASRVTRHFLRLLESATSDPGQPLSDIAYVTEAELSQLVVCANKTANKTANKARRSRSWSPVHEVIAGQAHLRPDAAAIVSDGKTVTFGELELRANCLAWQLLGRGAGPESAVGVLLPRTPDLVVALLAVLKTGAAYIPLDPTDPADRRSYILKDAGVRLVVTDENGTAALSAVDVIVPVPMDADRQPAATTGAVGRSVTAQDLAYIIYTSGTTGRPKGVLVTHGGLINYLWWTADSYLTADGGTALFSSVAFDLVVPNLYTALMHGRPLHLLPAGFDMSELGSLLLTAGPLSFVKLAPGHLELLSSQLGPDSQRAVAGLVIAAGDRFNGALANRWSASGGRLAAEYGPTEITVGNSACFLDGPVDTELVPLGTPIPNTTAYVLDEAMRPVPVGVTGEIYVGGAGVAMGYLNQPALTAAKFLPDPFSGDPGARLYRTGDLAKVLPDGNFEFIGRADGQVKVRGHRVEPAEVENAICGHAAVQAAVVTAREGAPGHAELAAYVTVRPDTPAPRQAELREFLSAKLPEYMVPVSIIQLAEFPLTSNGKIDHRALPAPDRESRGADTPYADARTDTERELAAAWRKVLNIADVGVRDSFFELGGDSVRAVALVGDLRAAGFDVRVRDVFEHRTIARLATALGDRAGRALDAPLVKPFELITDADRARLPAGISDAYPMSRIQLGMTVEMLSSGSEGNYHNVTSYLIRDTRPYSATAFQAAVDLAVERHEVLRTSMDLVSYSEPMQLVHERARLTVGSGDLRLLDEPERERALQQYMAAERGRLFDLSQPPLLRFFVHIYNDSWRLTFTEFHPILEGWSLHQIIMEILDSYRRLADGRQPAPAALPSLRYADFIALERQELATPAHAQYWQAVVAAFPKLTLPQAWGGAPGPTQRIYLRYRDLAAGLRHLATRANAPMKSVVHAAHLKVMSMIMPEAAFSSGLICDTRPEIAGADRVSGMYLNTVPFPFRPSARTWAELVSEVFTTEIDMWPHRRYPFGSIKQENGGERAADVAFLYLDFRMIDTGLVDLDAGIDDSPSEFSLTVSTHGGVLSLMSRPQDVAPANLERLREMYRSVLEAMAADPEGDAGQTFLPRGDHAALLSLDCGSHAATGAGSRLDVPVHELIERQAASTPHRTAVVFEGERVSYRELDQRADQLAHRLRKAGAGRERVIAVHLERSIELVVAVLATMKTGAVLLPVDPEYPAGRHQPSLAEASPRALISQGRLSGIRPPTTAPVIVIDEEGGRFVTGKNDGDRTNAVLSGDQLAYVMYTSGTTGGPKGVLNTHYGLTNELLWLQASYRLGPDDAVLHKAPLSFDVAIAEILWPIAFGARLVLARPGSHRDPRYLAELIERERVTVAHFVPSVLAVFLDVSGVFDRCRGLRRVISSGEELPPGLQQRFLTALPWVALSNLYGPAEAAIHATAWECRPDGQRRTVPIGRPIDRMRAYVCDDDLRLVPVGVPGELCLGGPGVGRGYLNQPGLTAERFAPDPFSDVPGARLYRTGDRARVLADGLLEFLGRRDRQVKVRGTRIELSEIEAVLREHDAVLGCVVDAYPDADGRPRLAAYVITGEAVTASSREELAAYSRGRLPSAMVPDSFTLLPEMPLLPSGKIDRAALPRPVQPQRRSQPLAPRTPVEETLLGIWQEVLHDSAIGVADDFFDLGGDSLLGIRVLTMIDRRLGARLPVSSLSSERTIAAQARMVHIQPSAKEGGERPVENHGKAPRRS